MLDSTNFNGSGLSGQDFKTVEKVHYMGDLRIVGQVVENLSDKQPIGYVVMTERTQKFKMYTVNQTKSLLSKFKFVNAELKDGNIVNTECAMTRMPKYFPNMRIADNHGIIIIGEIVDGAKVSGYRALDNNGVIVDLTESDLIDFNNRGMNLINAKIVTKNNKSYVSAIKNEFTKIEKSKIKDLKPTESKGSLWRKQMHANKWLNYGALRALRWAFLGNGQVVNDYMLSRYPEKICCGRGYFDTNREAAILAKEVYTKKNGIVLSPEDAELYKRIIREISHTQLFGYTKEGHWVNPSPMDSLFIVMISQFILNNSDEQKLLLDQLSNNPHCYNSRVIKQILESGYACKSLKDTVAKLKQIETDKYNEYANNPGQLTEKHREKMFKTREFIQALDIAQLGFAISESNRNYKFKTKTGYNKTLLYLGDIIGGEFDKYKAKSRYLGDLVSIAYIEKLKSKIDTYYGMNKEDMIAVIEMIIAISFIFNSKAMQAYVNDNVDELDRIGVLIPDWDEIAGIDYKLPAEIKMYYASGFNVFLNDNRYLKRPYHGKHLRYAELINYRQLGISHNIEHPMLKTELAPIVNMVTSDNCEAQTIDKFIGQLRFL